MEIAAAGPQLAQPADTEASATFATGIEGDAAGADIVTAAIEGLDIDSEHSDNELDFLDAE